MRLLTSIPFENGIFVTDLKAGTKSRMLESGLGCVRWLKLSQAGALLAASDNEIGLYDLAANRPVYFFSKRDAEFEVVCDWSCGAMDISGETGHAVIALKPGIACLWRDYAIGRSQYIYLAGHDYSEAWKHKRRHQAALEAAKSHFQRGETRLSLCCLRSARNVPGYSFDTETVAAWREFGANEEKVGIRRLKKVATYNRTGELKYDSICGIGALHPSGDTVVFSSEGLPYSDPAGVVLPGSLRVLSWDVDKSSLDQHGCGWLKESQPDEIACCVNGGYDYVFFVSGRQRYVIGMDFANGGIIELDRGDFSYNYGSRCSIAVSASAEWVATCRYQERVEDGQPIISLWRMATKERVLTEFDCGAKQAYNIAFCRIGSREFLVAGCDNGLAMFAVLGAGNPRIVGGEHEYRMVVTSSCQTVVAAASWIVSRVIATTIEIYSATRGFVFLRQICFDGNLLGMRLTKNGDLLVVLTSDHLRVYSVVDGLMVYEIDLDIDGVTRLSDFSLNESRIAIVGHKTISVYEFDWEYYLSEIGEATVL
jgi:hypothetical protein